MSFASGSVKNKFIWGAVFIACYKKNKVICKDVCTIQKKGAIFVQVY
jgi:hypothetical protein